MPSFAACLLCTVALAGNIALWVGVLNRVHGLGIPRVFINAGSALSLFGLFFGPWALFAVAPSWSPDCFAAISLLLKTWLPTPPAGLMTFATIYAIVCLAVAIGPGSLWLSRVLFRRDPMQLLSTRTTSLELAKNSLGEKRSRGLGRVAALVPGNEIFRLDVTEKNLAIPSMPAQLDGLSIAHLSDLHFSGRIGLDYFREAIERVNALRPDMVAITGDILDRDECLAWIPETLGQLRAPYGVYYVLGNHDCWIDIARLRRTLAAAGLVNLGSQSRRLEIAGKSLELAGNERPWIRPSQAETPRERSPVAEFRILLSHSPDQIRWARRQSYNLMLAGHTHGGQVRLPLLGPVLAPSLYGTKYASGTFYLAPTLLHVSRGLSGLAPFRWNCPPEVSLLRLAHVPTKNSSRDAAQETAETVPG